MFISPEWRLVKANLVKVLVLFFEVLYNGACIKRLHFCRASRMHFVVAAGVANWINCGREARNFGRQP
jgi:hypothetical protein